MVQQAPTGTRPAANNSSGSVHRDFSQAWSPGPVSSSTRISIISSSPQHAASLRKPPPPPSRPVTLPRAAVAYDAPRAATTPSRSTRQILATLASPQRAAGRHLAVQATNPSSSTVSCDQLLDKAQATLEQLYKLQQGQRRGGGGCGTSSRGQPSTGGTMNDVVDAELAELHRLVRYRWAVVLLCQLV